MSSTGTKYNEQELTNLMDGFRVPAIKTKEEAWDNFKALLTQKGKVATKRSLNYLIYAIAASIALFIGISSWFYYKGDIKVWCPPAQMIAVALPDGSQVILNAASYVTFNKGTWNKSRQVQLNGEAFFRVKKGRKFEVITETGKITVLGTTFNVFSRNKCLEVYCETGKVAVMSGNTVLLKPGMKAQTNKGTPVQITNAEQDHEAAWRQGDFWFNNAPLSKVIAELERQFDITIKYKDLTNRYYTGYFSRSSLEDALRYVLVPMQLKYKIENKTIYIITK